MSTLPPIPSRMADRPVQGGVAIPWVALEMPDGTWDLAGCQARRVNLAMLDGRCQLCGRAILPPFVFFATEDQADDTVIELDAPPLHKECADYAAAVCPMLHGRLDTYRAKASRAHRTDSCRTPGCTCGGWQVDESAAGRMGMDAPRWVRIECQDYQRAVTHKGLERRLRVGLGMPGERVWGRPAGILRREPVVL